jgi:hypothetical protein
VEDLKEYGKRTQELWKDGVPVLHQAPCESNADIIRFLAIVQAAEHTNTVNGL